ncbi:MAG: carboxypeptidase regulatory-like domain-containing protein [Vicinamibacterales bacterium]
MTRRAAIAAGLAWGLLSGLWPGTAFAQGGTITGVVTTAAKAPRPLRVTLDAKVCGATLPDESIVVGPDGGLANAVVRLTGVTAHAPYPDPHVTNEKCRFTPRVQLARPGAPTKTSSKDPLLHTTNAQQDGGRTLFNVGLPVPDMVVTRPLNGPGLVRITCNTHTWMRGYIIVTEDAAAVTGADGHFTLSGVPPGTYELTVWHETLNVAPQKVTVKAGGTTTVSLTATK